MHCHEEHCLVCGAWLSQGTDRRYKALQEVDRLVHLHCTATMMVHGCITTKARQEREAHARRAKSAPGSDCPCAAAKHARKPSDSNDRSICYHGERQSMCTPCINWLRRLSKRTPGKKREAVAGWKSRTLMPMDEFLCFLSHPGGERVPDKRVMYRLLESVTQQKRANVYSAFVPSYVLENDLAQQARHLSNDPSNKLTLNDAAQHVIVRAWLVANGNPIALSNAEAARLVRKYQQVELEVSSEKSPETHLAGWQ